VGFYSAFIVADRVTVETRRAGAAPSEGVRWESAGEGDYTIEPIEKTSRGTDIILHLRAGEEELLSSWKLKSIIRKYSDHISLPIVMKKEEWDEEKKETVVKDEFETVNQASALWARSKSDITKEQYDEFYKHVSHDFQAPLPTPTTASKAAANTPSCCTCRPRPVRPVGPQQARRHQAVREARLHHGRRRAADAGLPALREGRDRLNDLPLNVSREILQESRDVRVIREGSTKRVLGMLEEWPTPTSRKARTSTSPSGRNSARC
jgi:molecular chaperone HtpG